MMKKPYQQNETCPECGKKSLAIETNEAGELIGVSCRQCRHKAELRPFPFEGAAGYFIGDDGRAYSILKGLRAITPKSNRGFLRARISVDGRHYYPYLAPAVLTAFVSPRPPGLEPRHKDSDPANCRAANLEWALLRSAQVDAKRFIAAWQTSTTPREVADRTGLTYLSVIQRAIRMRKHGVPLKDMRQSSGRKLDWDELAKLAEEYGEQNGSDE